MKTKGFASDAEISALVHAFETATIPSSEFTHAAHVAVALSYLNARELITSQTAREKWIPPDRLPLPF